MQQRSPLWDPDYNTTSGQKLSLLNQDESACRKAARYLRTYESK